MYLLFGLIEVPPTKKRCLVSNFKPVSTKTCTELQCLAVIFPDIIPLSLHFFYWCPLILCLSKKLAKKHFLSWAERLFKRWWNNVARIFIKYVNTVRSIFCFVKVVKLSLQQISRKFKLTVSLCYFIVAMETNPGIWRCEWWQYIIIQEKMNVKLETILTKEYELYLQIYNNKRIDFYKFWLKKIKFCIRTHYFCSFKVFFCKLR